jgi:hypothetical protein
MSASTPIETVDDLKYYLAIAIQLEHATIPPYLTAAYSAKIEANGAAIDAITTVAKEEMLHLTLAANLLNAVGGTPDLMRKCFVPTYPCHLPNGETDFAVSIERFSSDAICTFLKIERPSRPRDEEHAATEKQVHGEITYVANKDLREDTRGRGRGLLPHVKRKDNGREIELHYWSIGEFYNAIRSGFRLLSDKLGQEMLFQGDKAKQVNPKYYFSAGGDLTAIINLDTALKAIDLISIQGEGYTDEIRGVEHELPHYYRFEQIKLKQYYCDGDKPHHPQGKTFPRDYSSVYPIRKDAKIAHYSAYPEIQEQARRFNGRYKQLLKKLNDAFNGQPDTFASLYGDMYQIKREMEYLIRNPLPGTGENAAPTFEMDECICPSEEK